jgi:drug/metabolite transporter (DMT)-like permease
MFVAVFSAVGYSVMVRNLAIAYNVFSIVSWQTVLGLLYFLPIFLVFEWNTVRQVNWSVAIILPVAELALFGSALAFLFYTYSIKKLGMTRAAVYSNLIPVFTALFAWILLREKLTWLKINGMLIVISGLLLSQYNPGIRAENRKAG